MNIRQMSIDDYPALYALWLSCHGMGLNDADDSLDGIGRFLRRNPATCFVCHAGDRLVGAIMAGHDGRRGYIYHTAVAQDFRRQGVAAALVNRCLDALREEGISKVALVAFSRNEQGNAFWQEMGFALRTDLSYRNKALTDIKRMDT